ncbi:hypothetical protein TP2_14325 [Thioclava pacifica DSM 10166]|uniref:AMP-dependent synthetase/ligase domain-containing protein n=2 Tax=Thioclava pacifica TaxID=285109 RepID=A0A074J4F9_9RHOB|nr:hypothetical protein TP2_14325 [Thioclava pacifica DSM 10166]
MAQNILSLLRDSAETYGDRVAMLDPSGQPVSFRNFQLMILSFADRLETKGVSAGQTVVVDLQDRIANMLLRLAVMHLGATATNVPYEVLAANGVSEPEWYLGDSAQAQASGQTRFIPIDPSWIAPPRRVLPLVEGGAMIRSTSGTTGVPKLRLITATNQSARILRSAGHRAWVEGPALVGYASVSSPGTNHFLRLFLEGSLQLGMAPTPEATLHMMDTHGVTKLLAPPHVFEKLLRTARESGFRPSGLQQIVLGGSAVSPETAREAEAIFGCELFNTYGSSETGSIAHFRPATREGGSRIMGRIYSDYPAQLRKEDGRLAAPGEEGELLLQVDPEIALLDYPSRQPLVNADGWFATGDVGRFLPDGSFELTSRLSDLLNVGGNKFAPSHFEALALDHGHVAEVIAFRAPVENGMDEIGLAIVGKEGFALEDFCHHMTHRLGTDFPFHVALLPEIPLTAAGKADRKGLTRAFVEWRAETA